MRRAGLSPSSSRPSSPPAAGCIPRHSGPTGLDLATRATAAPKAQPVTPGSAAVIDANDSETLYERTSIQQSDPRPALLAGKREPCCLWVADPHNGVLNGPKIIWLHGGGFAVGIASTYGPAKCDQS